MVPISMFSYFPACGYVRDKIRRWSQKDSGKDVTPIDQRGCALKRGEKTCDTSSSGEIFMFRVLEIGNEGFPVTTL